VASLPLLAVISAEAVIGAVTARAAGWAAGKLAKFGKAIGKFFKKKGKGKGECSSSGVGGGKAPDQVTPGVRERNGHYVDNLGNAHRWRARYDRYGRQIERTDFTRSPEPSTHTNPHHHIREYGPGYGRKGRETYHEGPGPNTGGGP